MYRKGPAGGVGPAPVLGERVTLFSLSQPGRGVLSEVHSLCWGEYFPRGPLLCPARCCLLSQKRSFISSVFLRSCGIFQNFLHQFELRAASRVPSGMSTAGVCGAGSPAGRGVQFSALPWASRPVSDSAVGTGPTAWVRGPPLSFRTCRAGLLGQVVACLLGGFAFPALRSPGCSPPPAQFPQPRPLWSPAQASAVRATQPLGRQGHGRGGASGPRFTLVRRPGGCWPCRESQPGAARPVEAALVTGGLCALGCT